MEFRLGLGEREAVRQALVDSLSESQVGAAADAMRAKEAELAKQGVSVF
jgi:hypothetical protein